MVKLALKHTPTEKLVPLTDYTVHMPKVCIGS